MFCKKERMLCYHTLVTYGYTEPKPFFEKKSKKLYQSYWGDGERRMEVLYDSHDNKILITILDKGIIIKQLKIQGQPTQKRRHWRQRAAFLRGG